MRTRSASLAAATLVVALSSALFSPGAFAQAASAPTSITEQEAFDIGVEAYVYLYPLVSMEITRRVSINYEPGVRTGMGPMNMFHHMRAYPPADFREVVRPNFDTLYSSAWLDLTREPVVVSAPDTRGRYYLLPMYDMWTDAFAVPGKRTSGTGASAWAIVPAGWTGTLPQGVERIDAPTPYVWIIGRTQTNGPDDYDAVHQVQDGYRIVPLSQWGKSAVPPAPFKPDPSVDVKTPPLDQVNGMAGTAYFALAAEIMKTNPPHQTDWSVVARMKRIGLVPGRAFDAGKLDPAVRAALDRAAVAGLKSMVARVPTMAKVVNGWQMNVETMGVYGNFYMKRAVIAMAGLGANQPDDAIYPLCVHDADGKALKGEENYVLHFDRDQLPPAGAFWSITMYDEQGFQAANPLNRFAISSWMPLKYNADGSLDVYLQNASPGKDLEANWLPAPKGTLGVTMRLYAPRPSALDGTWVPPAVKRVPR